jgi:MFS family permease
MLDLGKNFRLSEPMAIMTSRERLAAALNHPQPDRVCVDFGGTWIAVIHTSIVHQLKQRLIGPVTWVILAEIFPTAVRGRALGLATFFLWTADYAVTQTFPMMDAKGSWLVVHFNHAFPFYIYAAFCVALAWVVWRLVPETKGRSLEDIERSWTRK